MKKEKVENKFRLKLVLEEIVEGEMVENIQLFKGNQVTSSKEGIERIFHAIVWAFDFFLNDELNYLLFPESDGEEKSNVREE